MSERLAAPSGETAAPRAGVRLQTRGVVQAGALYIARHVDGALVTALQAGRWSVVLGPRFSGKSSLRVRTVQALRETSHAGTDALPVPYRCATIEARSLPAAASGAVYLALCNAVASELRLPAVNGFWQRHSDEPPVERFRQYLLHEIVTADARTVILFDDLDALQLLPLDLPELLATLGQVHETLMADDRAGRLTLAFFSAVTPERLTAAPTPWAPERFLLPDFTRAEVAAFGQALAALVRDAEPASVQSFVDAVFSWTAGHPQLTQHLCQQLVARAPSSGGAAAAGSEAITADERVERLLHKLYLDQEDAVAEDPCLREMVQALTRSAQAGALIALYRRLLGGVPVPPDALDAVQRELRLCGLATAADDAAGTPRLRPRCRLVATLLGDAWAREYEVRLILQETIARDGDADERAAPGKLLRGVPLKTAQAWARKNPAALQPPEVRLLLASLEAARSEAEAKHQASAAALQRELRDKTELRYLVGPAGAPSLAASGHAGAARSGRLPVGAALGLLLCLAAATWASAHRRAARFERASQEATARAVRAEQTIRTLQSELTTKAPAPVHVAGAAPAPTVVTQPDTASIQVANAAPTYLLRAAPPRIAGTALLPVPLRTTLPRNQPTAPAPPRRAAGHGSLTGTGSAARQKMLLSTGSPARHAAARDLGICPDPGRPAH